MARHDALRVNGTGASGTVQCGGGGKCYGNGALALAGTQGTCKVAAAEGSPCDPVAGPPCLSPAGCVITVDGGTTGSCTLPSASACN